MRRHVGSHVTTGRNNSRHDDTLWTASRSYGSPTTTRWEASRGPTPNNRAEQAHATSETVLALKQSVTADDDEWPDGGIPLREGEKADTDRAEAVRDLREAELALKSPDTSETSEEARLATLMQDAPIPTISSPPERTWIWSDLHLADRSVLAAWNRPFRNIEEMNHHLLRE